LIQIKPTMTAASGLFARLLSLLAAQQREQRRRDSGRQRRDLLDDKHADGGPGVKSAADDREDNRPSKPQRPASVVGLAKACSDPSAVDASARPAHGEVLRAITLI